MSGNPKLTNLNAVANYDLCEAHTLLEDNTVLEAARHMAAKNLDFVLVVNGSGRLTGIVTDKDLAFRGVAASIDMRHCSVAQIMSPRPVCLQSSLSMIEALRLMAENHFRHLPVLDKDRIVGVLDIAKCFYDALVKVELADAAASQIASALEFVGKEFSGVLESSQNKTCDALNVAGEIRDALASPLISTLLERPNRSVCLRAKGHENVLQVIKSMQAEDATGVLVTNDADEALLGIFTSKDIMLRIVAAGRDATHLTLSQVMTPNPEFITPKLSIVSALRQMYTGKYLHLPVLMADEPRSIVGIVDVLQLTDVIMSQLRCLHGDKPMWHELWSSGRDSPSGAPIPFTKAFHDVHSGSSAVRPPGYLHVSRTPSIVDEFSIPSSIVFKINYINEAIIMTIENPSELPKLDDILTEALARFGLLKGTLNYVGTDRDLVPVKSDVELNRHCSLATIGGNDWINFVLTPEQNGVQRGTPWTPALGTALVIVGAFLGLLLFRLRIDS